VLPHQDLREVRVLGMRLPVLFELPAKVALGERPPRVVFLEQRQRVLAQTKSLSPLPPR